MKFQHGMVAPLVALFVGVVGFPLAYAFYLSITDYRLTSHGTPKLVGAQNYVEFGIGQARRAWLTKSDVVNTRTWKQIERIRKSRPST